MLFTKDKLQVMLAEFLGTSLLSLVVLRVSHVFGLGTAAWYTSLSAGLALGVIVALFGRFSGAHVNPAITIGLWTLKKIDAATAIVFVSTQMLAGAISMLLYSYLTGERLAMTGHAGFSGRMFIAEMIGSVIFGVGVAMAATRELKEGFASFTIGASLALGSMVASIAAPGFLNPAIALADNAWDKTVVIAPIIGITIGLNLYYYAFEGPEAQAKRRK